MEASFKEEQVAGDLQRETVALLEEEAEVYGFTYDTKLLTILCC